MSENYPYWLLVLMVVIWVVVLLPQMREQKRRAAMLKSLKKGDKAITIGGIYGEVTAVEDDHLMFKIAEKTEIRIVKSAIGQIVQDK